MLIFGFAAYGMLFGYLFGQYLKRHRIPRPEDRFDATYTDGEGEVGYFPSASIWPAGAGLGLIFGVVGLTFGLWYLIPAGILFFGAVIGWITESEYEVEVPDSEEEEEAAAAAGHPGHLDPHPEHLRLSRRTRTGRPRRPARQIGGVGAPAAQRPPVAATWARSVTLGTVDVEI